MIDSLKGLDLSLAPERDKTFLEVTGCSTKETVISNILAFFFDPNEAHGFDNLFISSFLNVIGQEEKNFILENVATEESTEKNNRIDLVLELNNLVIGIENKIYAGINNPMADYKKHLEGKGKNNILVLLSLYEIKKYDGVDCCVTYKELFTEVKKNLGNYITGANSEYCIFLKHFINNMENLMTIEKKFDEKTIEVLARNEYQINSACETLRNYKIHLLEKFRNKIKGEYTVLNSAMFPSDAKSVKNYDFRYKEIHLYTEELSKLKLRIVLFLGGAVNGDFDTRNESTGPTKNTIILGLLHTDYDTKEEVEKIFKLEKITSWWQKIIVPNVDNLIEADIFKEKEFLQEVVEKTKTMMEYAIEKINSKNN